MEMICQFAFERAQLIDKYNVSVSLFFVGDTGVGKTAIMQRWNRHPFPTDHSSTIGVDVVTHFEQVRVWDSCSLEILLSLSLLWSLCQERTANEHLLALCKFLIYFLRSLAQEPFINIRRKYYTTSSVFVWVYDLTNETTLHSLDLELPYIQQLCKKKHLKQPLIVVCGNKVDLISNKQRRTFVSKAKAFCESKKDQNVIFGGFVSAKTEENIFEFIQFVVEKYYQQGPCCRTCAYDYLKNIVFTEIKRKKYFKQCFSKFYIMVFSTNFILKITYKVFALSSNFKQKINDLNKRDNKQQDSTSEREKTSREIKITQINVHFLQGCKYLQFFCSAGELLGHQRKPFPLEKLTFFGIFTLKSFLRFASFSLKRIEKFKVISIINILEKSDQEQQKKDCKNVNVCSFIQSPSFNSNTKKKKKELIHRAQIRLVLFLSAFITNQINQTMDEFLFSSSQNLTETK
ncbi:hypothetical protein RFI_00710 [Reticulomyxa filosa]|uniref:Uncharacterized protein n=1 Tax=Reticulomyxa filosa TaxID=46433 RepID=X6PDS7_RETFI|nr:hypothetical protein RFI_00710 [Reticulomyxa filosa]|eukprot:ETO36351.1 hypothetical protein RFI_00710 [Reticulomyxa filosa]